MRKLLVSLMVLSLVLAAIPAQASEESPREEIDASIHTLLVAGTPIFLAAVHGSLNAQQAAFSELVPFWFIPYGIIVGNYIEWRYDPEKMGRGYRYNGNPSDGSEDYKWETRPNADGTPSRWKWLKAYPNRGIVKAKAKPKGGRAYVHESVGLLERIGG